MKIFILITFFLLTRLYMVREIPSSVYWDEASIGYNAYSILETGKDEWEKVFPLHFRAFGEFKLPVYIYTVAVFESFLGLNELAIRLPAILFSLGSVLVLYFLVLKILNSQATAFLSAFFLTISPWFFILSRTGYEATAGLFFFLLGIYLCAFKNIWTFLLAIIIFTLSIYSYTAFRILIPISLPLLIYLNLSIFKNKSNSWNYGNILLVAFVITVFFVTYIPIYKVNVYDTASIRNSAISVFADSRKSMLEKTLTITRNYFSHFDPTFLFINGDKNLRSQQPNFGQLYFPDLFFLILGLFLLFKNIKTNRWLSLLLFLFFISPIPAAITKESPHALRSIALAPFLSLITAMGLVFFIKNYQKYKIGIIVSVVYLLLFGNYYHYFVKQFPIESSKEWQYGYKQIFTKYNNDFNNFDQIVISSAYGQPYIFALFYLKYDPEDFTKNVKRDLIDNTGFSNVASFKKMTFTKIDPQKTYPAKSLIFASPEEQIDNLTPQDTITFRNGEIAFFVYTL